MSLTFVLAPDSFKESMTADQACMAMQRGIHQVFPHARCIHVPMADGGEGTVDALITSLSGQKVECTVRGPLASQCVQTYLGWIESERTAVIEMAKANGIHLLEKELRDPMLTSSYGTGEMIRLALDVGAKKIIIGLGGSVTNDAGAGMAQALGVKFYDQFGLQVDACGGNLDQIVEIDITLLDPRLSHTEIMIASDVNNPLCGEHGASYVFAPQKGANAEIVKTLDHHLEYFSDLVEERLRIHVKHIAGAGAAGGLGFGLMAFAGAKIRSGVSLVVEQVALAEKIIQADYVFTGEGKIDFQTKFGKTPFGVAQVAKELAKPVIAFAGLVDDENNGGISGLFQQGFTEILSINPPNTQLEMALKNAEFYLEQACIGVCENLA